MYSENDFDNNWEDSVFSNNAIINSLWDEYDNDVQKSISALETEIEEFISLDF